MNEGRQRTRRRILVLLCERPQTVAELASQLDLTNNAVRAHLDKMKREGLVRRGASRRGVQRPHTEYELTDQGHAQFPKAYEPLLAALVDLLNERLPGELYRELLVQTGSRALTERFGLPSGKTPRQKIQQIVGKLNGGGIGIEVTTESGKSVIRSCSCPVSAVNAAHPELC